MTADIMLLDIDAQIADALVHGRWHALSDLTRRAGASGKIVPAVLTLLATGEIGDFLSCSRADLLPDYRLRKAIYPSAGTADRLCMLAQQATRQGHRAFAILLQETALAFDDRCVTALLCLAWAAYAAADPARALAYAERAQEADTTSAETAATLGWMQWESGLRERAVETLTEALRCDPHHAIAHWYLGNALGRLGKLAEADGHLRQALQCDPALDEAAVTLAWTLADAGKPDEALRIARDMAERNPLPHRLAQLGHLLMETGDCEAALAPLERAFTADAMDPTVRRRFAVALSRTGRLGEAQALIEEGLRRTPDNLTLTLARCALLHESGATGPGRLLAKQIVKQWPTAPEGWHLRGLLHLDDPKKAEVYFAEAQAQDPAFHAAILARARVLLRLKQASGAAWLMRCVLDQAPDLAAAHLLLAHALLEQRQPDQARAHLHRLLRQPRQRKDGAIWNLLSIALQAKERPRSARLAARRACRLAPDSPDVLRHAATLALESGDPHTAVDLCRRLLDLAPREAAAQALAAFVFQAAGHLREAERHAELAVAMAPDRSESWRCLGHVRHHQNRLAEAEEALHQAHRIDPGRSDVLRQLTWVLAADDRLAEALIAADKACEAAPEEALCWQQRADLLGMAGRHDEAIPAVRRALELRPHADAFATDAQVLLARLLAEQAQGAPEDRRQELQGEAAGYLADVLRRRPDHHWAGLLALRLHAVSAAAADLARVVPPAQRRRMYMAALEWLAAFGNAEECRRVAAAAHRTFPRDPEIEIAGLYLMAMAGGDAPDAMARRLRQWGLRHAMACGSEPHRSLPPATLGRPMRVAYLASHFHHGLLNGILAAHDPDAVELHLYCDDTASLAPDVRSRITVHALSGTDLGASCAANGIEIVVDTVGLHPFHGQKHVLRALRRRIAPLQCGWLGGWGPGAGLFDLLITDETALPAEQADVYQEEILRLTGGQWSWTPPTTAPAITPPPARARGYVTFGCDVRGFRLPQDCLEQWATLLAAIPDATLELLGRHGRDWGFREGFATVLRRHDVDPGRVTYRFQRAYGDHLRFFQQIDIMLDSFPANGGLSLLDPLWMGVPVVTLAGTGLAGERQGASILQSAGCGDWVARDKAGYIDLAHRLARDVDGLTEIRQQLRARVAASPLLEPRRITAALEQCWRRLRAEAQEIATAPDAKARSRAVARRHVRSWLERNLRLRLPASPRPDISVVVVLFNQAGLSLQTFAALADQEGIAVETIIVDNASQDETGELLARIDGATIIRNTENVGFLLAANQGAALARGRHILFLNSDAFLHRDALATALRRLDGDPGIGVVGGRIVLADGSLQEAGCVAFGDGSAVGYGRGQDPNRPEFRFLRDVDYVSGAFLMVRRPLWQMLDGFDTALAPAYFEDTDFCFRVRRAGFRVVYDPAILVSHLEWGSATSAAAVQDMMDRNQTLFRTRHAETLAQRPLPVDYVPARDRWAAMAAPRLLIIDNGVPHQAGGAGQPRARLMMEAIARHHATFFPLWAIDDDWDEVYQTMPAETEVMLGQGFGRLEAFLEERRGLYDTVLISRPPNMARIAEIRHRRPALFAGMRIIYDAEALFALRDIGQAALQHRPLPRAEARRLIDAEIALARQADCVLAVSAREARLFRAGGVPDVRILCHSARCHPAPPPHHQREGLLFIGALNPDTPNEDSLIWLAEEILPRLNQRLGHAVPVTIIGECRSSRISALASDQIRLTGRIDDLSPWYDRARVFLAPTRYAAGVPAKVIEAACAGLPVVATQLLVRQLGWQSGREILGARHAEDFAAAIATLYQDGASWNDMQQAALRRAAVQFAEEGFTATLRAALAGEPA